MHKLVNRGEELGISYRFSSLFSDFYFLVACGKHRICVWGTHGKAGYKSSGYPQAAFPASRMRITSGVMRTLYESQAQAFAQALCHINSDVLKVIPIIPRTYNKHCKRRIKLL